MAAGRSLNIPAKLINEPRVRLGMSPSAPGAALEERALPGGFRIVKFGEAPNADAAGWAKVIVQAGERPDEQQAKAQFETEFAGKEQQLRERMFFILDDYEEAVGTGTAWYFEGLDGEPGRGRVHWVSVAPSAQGQGLAKCVMAAVLACLRELHGESIGMVTHTQAARAISMYAEMGFTPSAIDGEAMSEEERAGWAALTKHGLRFDGAAANGNGTSGAPLANAVVPSAGDILSELPSSLYGGLDALALPNVSVDDSEKMLLFPESVIKTAVDTLKEARDQTLARRRARRRAAHACTARTGAHTHGADDASSR